MGLKLTLNQENNSMGFTFVDAYWVIENLKYKMTDTILLISFNLNCYPSRESSKLTGRDVVPLSLGIPEKSKYSGKLYEISFMDFASKIFSEGMPLERDEQLKQIYTFIKAYTDLPFEDVFESDQIEEEPQEETEVEPTEEPTEEPTGETIQEPSSEEEPMAQEEASDDPEEEDNFVNSEETETENKEQTEILTEEEQTETEPQTEGENTEEETEDAHN